ncbi:TPA: DUF1364 family protein [Escherichia coli]|nr:DUF1364 family protein [Escherichia coli]ELN8663632.1 DUF1364 family protein [Escherichia coli]HAH9856424.1 DUF1364 family protein [Escherichia coli]HAI2048563.1 DUF1364 family protein [Escherichia coli]HAM4644354.1 DUF1364 family protein [Escherichia coli]
MNPAIKTAINIVGSQKKLGAACEVSQQAVYKWLHNKAKVAWLIKNGCDWQQGGIMADLRKAARGRECQVRIPGVCNGNSETSVLAHIRLAGLCGTGIKPPDLIATIACSACHDEIDRRTHFVDAGYAKECALEGMARTQVIWLKEGVIKA